MAEDRLRLPLRSASTHDGDPWVFVEAKDAHLEGWSWVVLDGAGRIVDGADFELERAFPGDEQTGPIWWAYDGLFKDSQEALQAPSGELYTDLELPRDVFPHPLADDH